MRHTKAIEEEVTSLAEEVARLRVMVDRCVELNLDLQQRQAQQPPPAAAHTVPFPTPDQPLAVLPTMFSGIDGTTRLLKLIVETYPWLKQAIEPEKRSNSRKKTGCHRKQKNKGECTSSSESSRSSSTDGSSSKKSDCPKSRPESAPKKNAGKGEAPNADHDEAGGAGGPSEPVKAIAAAEKPPIGTTKDSPPAARAQKIHERDTTDEPEVKPSAVAPDSPLADTGSQPRGTGTALEGILLPGRRRKQQASRLRRPSESESEANRMSSERGPLPPQRPQITGDDFDF